MANTPIYGWETPDDTDYVYQGAAAARTTANAIDSTLSSQVTTLNATINSTVAPYPQGIKAYIRSTTELITPTTGETILMTTNAPFTPVAGRLYEITVTVGNIQKETTVGAVYVTLRKGAGGTLLSRAVIEFDTFDDFDTQTGGTYTWTQIFTTTQLGTSSFTPYVYGSTNLGGATLQNSTTYPGCIIVKDIGNA
jgi:hypothetical protein